MMGTTALGYLAAWGPFAGLCIWEMVAEPQVELLFISFWSKYMIIQEISAEYRFIASLFCKSATAYNPFIYFFMFKGFRDDTRHVFNRLAFDNKGFYFCDVQLELKSVALPLLWSFSSLCSFIWFFLFYLKCRFLLFLSILTKFFGGFYLWLEILS